MQFRGKRNLIHAVALAVNQMRRPQSPKPCPVKALYEMSLKFGGRQYAGELLVDGRPF
jgi:hypothetical protein